MESEKSQHVGINVIVFRCAHNIWPHLDQLAINDLDVTEIAAQLEPPDINADGLAQMRPCCELADRDICSPLMLSEGEFVTQNGDRADPRYM